MSQTAIYMRVSSRQQTTESQKPELDAHARQLEAAGEQVVWFTDTFTGRSMDRPGIDEMLEGVRARKYQRIVIWRLDRLGRTAKGLCSLFDELRELGADLVSLKDCFTLDSPSGRLHARILASVAEFETEVRAERVRAGNEAAKERVREARRLLRSDWTPEAVARQLKLTEAQVHRIIKHPKVASYWGGCGGRPHPKPLDREKIMAMLAAGLGIEEIARALNMSAPTLFRQAKSIGGMASLRAQAKSIYGHHYGQWKVETA